MAMAEQVLDEQDSLLEQVDHIFEAGGDKALGVLNEWVDAANVTAQSDGGGGTEGDGADGKPNDATLSAALNTSSATDLPPLLSPPKSSSTPVLSRKVPPTKAQKLQFESGATVGALGGGTNTTTSVPRVSTQRKGDGDEDGADTDEPTTPHADTDASITALDASAIDATPDDDGVQMQMHAADKPAESCSEFFVRTTPTHRLVSRRHVHSPHSIVDSLTPPTCTTR